MRIFLALALLAVALPAAAFDLGAHAHAKPPAIHQPLPADPEVIRQGGDTIFDAIFLPLPAHDITGTTTGYSDFSDEVCPFEGSTSPDVFYRLAPTWTMQVDIDMFGSSYDTKIYVYDASYQLVACNDDFYSDDTSKLENLLLEGDAKYYLVIDGYGGDHGEYLLNIGEIIPCEVECFDGGELVNENEPPLTIDYVDWHNGGCNTDPDDPPLQEFEIIHHHVATTMCGVSGFYPYQGSSRRDTDWFVLSNPGGYGAVELWGDAEIECSLFQLSPAECGSLEVVQNVTLGPCSQGSMWISIDPGETIWLWVGPTTFEAPDGSDVYEFDYQLVVIGSFFEQPVATETHSWTSVKSLFR